MKSAINRVGINEMGFEGQQPNDGYGRDCPLVGCGAAAG